MIVIGGARWLWLICGRNLLARCVLSIALLLGFGPSVSSRSVSSSSVFSPSVSSSSVSRCRVSRCRVSRNSPFASTISLGRLASSRTTTFFCPSRFGKQLIHIHQSTHKSNKAKQTTTPECYPISVERASVQQLPTTHSPNPPQNPYLARATYARQKPWS